MSLLSLILTFIITLFVLFGPMYSSGAGVLQTMGYVTLALFSPIAIAGLGLFPIRALKIIAAVLHVGVCSRGWVFRGFVLLSGCCPNVLRSVSAFAPSERCAAHVNVGR